MKTLYAVMILNLICNAANGNSRSSVLNGTLMRLRGSGSLNSNRMWGLPFPGLSVQKAVEMSCLSRAWEPHDRTK